MTKKNNNNDTNNRNYRYQKLRKRILKSLQYIENVN